MSAMRPNEQQEAVIRSLDRDVVVKAGAGSGKTMTLARRFADALPVDASWPGTRPDRILTITFANKAAGELVERVRNVLLARGDVDTARSLGSAWVSTVDAFCGRILRRYSLDVGIDPDFQILGDVERAALRKSVFDRVVDESGSAEALAIAYGTDVLRASVFQAYDRIASMGRGVGELEAAPSPDLRASALSLIELLSEYKGEVERLSTDPNKTQARNLVVSERIAEALESIVSPGAVDAEMLLDAVAGISFSAAAKPKEVAQQIKDALGAIRMEAATVITREPASAFCELLIGFSHLYWEEKAQLAAFDYADIMRVVADLLAGRPEIAKELAGQFDLIMVDEFQDTNRAQMRVIDSIREDNLCAVGDDQQSIYGFRYADREVFESLCADLGGPLPLAVNYRSHAEILEFVNGLFAGDELLGSGLQHLRPGRQESSAGSARWDGEPRVRVCVSDSSTRSQLSAREAQARIVADRVEEALHNGAHPSEIVILLRAMSGASVYAQALEARGVETVLASGEAFYESPEATEIRALLKTIIVPQDDQAMASLLSGRLVGLSPDALLGLRARAIEIDESLDGALMAATGGEWPAGFGDESDRDRARAAAQALRSLRRSQASRRVPELILLACDLLGYKRRLLAEGNAGRQGWANVLKLVRIARRLDASGPADVGTVLNYLADHHEAVPSEPAAVVTCADGEVRIMSVHAAKGLEFPVVIVADLARGMAVSDAPRILVNRFESDIRLAMKCPPDGSRHENERDLCYDDLRERTKLLELEEEKRIFYVACTRAEEVLVLVGDVGVEDPKAGTLAGLVMRGLGSPQESAVVACGGSSVSVEIERPDHWEPATAVRRPEPAVSRDASTPQPTPHEGDSSRSDTRAPQHRSLPERLSYSSISVFDKCPARFWLGVAGLRGPAEQRPDATEFGSAVHEALEAVMSGVPACNALSAVSEYRGMSAEDHGRLEAAVSAMLDGGTRQRIDAAKFVDAEVPFSVPAAGVVLEGSIDLIARNGASTLIVDYKTGIDREAAHSADRLNAYALQAQCYALAEIEAGATQVEVTFIFLEQQGREHSISFEAADLHVIRGEIEGRIEAMRASEGDRPSSRPAREVCSGCPGAGTVCAATPR